MRASEARGTEPLYTNTQIHSCCAQHTAHSTLPPPPPLPQPYLVVVDVGDGHQRVEPLNQRRPQLVARLQNAAGCAGGEEGQVGRRGQSRQGWVCWRQADPTPPRILRR